MSPNLRTAPSLLGVLARNRAPGAPGSGPVPALVRCLVITRAWRRGGRVPTGPLLQAHVLGNAPTDVGTVKRSDPLDCHPVPP